MRRALMVGLLCVLAHAAFGCASAPRFSGVILGVAGGFRDGSSRLVALRPDGDIRVIYEEPGQVAASGRAQITSGVYDWVRDRYYIALAGRGKLVELTPGTYTEQVVYRVPSEGGRTPAIYGLDIAPNCSYVLFVLDGVGVFRWIPGEAEAVRLCEVGEQRARVRAVGPEIAYVLSGSTLTGLDPKTGETRPIREGLGPVHDVDDTGGWLLESGGSPESLVLMKLTTFGVGPMERVVSFSPQTESGTVPDAWSSPSPVFAGEQMIVCDQPGRLWGITPGGTYLIDLRAGPQKRLTDLHLRALWHGPVTPP